MNNHLKVFLGVLVQSTPYIIAALVGAMHPVAAAPTGGIAEVTTGASYIQKTFLGAGLVVGAIGIGNGAMHLATHKEDWGGAGGRVGAGVAGCVIIGKAPALSTMFAPVTF